LGELFPGVLVADAYASYNGVHPKHRQSCLAHIKTKAKELDQELALLKGSAADPQARQFCQGGPGPGPRRLSGSSPTHPESLAGQSRQEARPHHAGQTTPTLRQARYRGKAKVRLQNYLIGAACNIRRLFRRIQWERAQGSQPNPCPGSSPTTDKNQTQSVSSPKTALKSSALCGIRKASTGIAAAHGETGLTALNPLAIPLPHSQALY
jgi:hypothetical protein